MGLFDILSNGALGSIIDSIGGKQGGGGLGGALNDAFGGGLGSVLDTFGDRARSVATNIRDNTPGGLGGLAGAGALGALFGNVLHGDIMKSVALAGAGAVAWNFYKKWAANQQGQQPRQGTSQQAVPAGWGNAAPQSTELVAIDPTAELVMRSMIYAARADGNIDAEEQKRIDQVLSNMFPGQDIQGPMQRIRNEAIDPNKIAVACGSPEQAEDAYRLSCAIIDIDHFMEHSYTEALAKALGISDEKKRELEKEADQARRALMASVQPA